METVIRAAAMYGILVVLFRLAGKRSLAQITTFDFVLLLVIGEATQQALLGEDFSLAQAALVVVSLLALQRASDYLTWRFSRFRRWFEGQPTVLVADGVPIERALDHYRLSTDDVVSAGRERHGISDMSQVGWAIMEVSGGITVIPWPDGNAAAGVSAGSGGVQPPHGEHDGRGHDEQRAPRPDPGVPG